MRSGVVLSHKHIIDTNVLPDSFETIMSAADLVPFPDCPAMRATYGDGIKLQPNFADTVVAFEFETQPNRYDEY